LFCDSFFHRFLPISGEVFDFDLAHEGAKAFEDLRSAHWWDVDLTAAGAMLEEAESTFL
jgi:hypothetical protein